MLKYFKCMFISGKKSFVLYLILFSIIIPLYSQNDYADSSNIPIEFKQYVKTEKMPIEYKHVITPETNYAKGKHCPKHLTKKEAFEDIEMLEYLFDTAYCGKTYWENQGVNFKSMYDSLRIFVEKCDEKVPTEKLEKIIINSLQGIQDGHLVLEGRTFHRFFDHKTAYFSKILIEKRNHKYIVIDSEVNEVPIGSIFTDDTKYLFPTLSPSGKEHFLIGKLSYDKISTLKFKFNNEIKEVPVHKCRMGHYDKLLIEMIKDPFFVEEKNGIQIVQITEFHGNDKDLKKFEKYAYKLKDTKRFIYSLFSNGGGSSIYGANFIKNLNGYCNSSIGIELSSPAIDQFWANLNIEKFENESIRKEILISRKKVDERKETVFREWDFETESTENLNFTDTTYNLYDGKVYVLANRLSASSAEYAVYQAKSLKHCVFIGENTAGMGRFGEQLSYYLPNSNILLKIPSEIFIYPKITFQEGVGIMPDYWLDAIRPEKDVVKWLTNPATYQFEIK